VCLSSIKLGMLYGFDIAIAGVWFCVIENSELFSSASGPGMR
jgi:hypothetical protein